MKDRDDDTSSLDEHGLKVDIRTNQRRYTNRARAAWYRRKQAQLALELSRQLSTHHRPADRPKPPVTDEFNERLRALRAKPKA